MAGTRRRTVHPDDACEAIPEQVLERFLQLVSALPVSPSGCREWPKGTNGEGYGQIGWTSDKVRRAALTHRLLWWHRRGPIPDGLTIQHTCHNRLCLDLDHMEVWGNLDNAADNGQGAKTHCPVGHLYDEANTYVDRRGHRRCRVCDRERKRAASRAVGKVAMRERRACPRGHVYTPATTYHNPQTGHRSCLTCRTERNAARAG